MLIKPKNKYHIKNMMINTIGNNIYSYLETYYLRHAYLKANIIFLHIPKCGGSSIARQIYGGNRGHHSANELNHRLPKQYIELPKFTLIRNPIHRIQSAYNYVISRGNDYGFVKQYPEYNEKCFQSFSRFITEWLPKYGTNKTGVIFKPQIQFLKLNDTVDKNIDIYRLDNFSTLISSLSENHGINISNILINANPNNRERTINKHLIKLIEEIYKSDFDLYETSCTP
jgi:sulfotransferase famil protein